MTPDANPLNVVIVDDHVALRRGMELLLRRRGHHVVGTADDAESAEALILRRRPDIALIDLALPGESGADLTRRLLAEHPAMRIVLYTGTADERQLLDGLDAGAAGFALKSGDPEELEEAIRTVAAGDEWLDPRVKALALALQRKRLGLAALPARARDPAAAEQGPHRRGGSQAALPLLGDRAHPRAQRDDQARRLDARARGRARPAARRDPGKLDKRLSRGLTP